MKKEDFVLLEAKMELINLKNQMFSDIQKKMKSGIHRRCQSSNSGCSQLAFMFQFIWNIYQIQMGNHNSDLTESQFRQQWRVAETNGDVVTWQNIRTPSRKVFQHRIRDDKIYTRQGLYQIRKTSPYLVNALVVTQDGFACTMDHSSNKIYVEAIKVRLSDVEDIPYPDIFHLYRQCLNGYIQLTDNVSFFSIDEEQIGINDEGVVKVWLSNQYQHDRVLGSRIGESQMVRELLNILQSKINQESRGRHQNLAWFIGNHEKITFREARDKFNQYMKETVQGNVPERLDCVFDHGGVNNIKTWIMDHDGNMVNSKIVQVIDGNSKVENRSKPFRGLERKSREEIVVVEQKPKIEEKRIIKEERRYPEEIISEQVIIENRRPVEKRQVIESRPVLARSESQRYEAREKERFISPPVQSVRVQPREQRSMRVEAPVQRERISAPAQRQVRVEAPRVETRVEAPLRRDVRVEGSRVEAPVQRDVRVEGSRVEAPVRRDVRVQSSRVQAPVRSNVRVQAPVQRQVRVEAPRVETRVEPVRREMRVQAPRVEAPARRDVRVQAPRVEVNNQRPIKVEAPRQRQVRVEAPVRSEVRPIIQNARPVEFKRTEAVQRQAPRPVEVRRDAPAERIVSARPVEAPVQRPVQPQIRRPESVPNENRPASIIVPPATQPLSVQRQGSLQTPIAKFDDKPRIQTKQSNPERSFTNPPQVVESISLTRPVERTNTEKIVENLQGNTVVTEKQSQSLVTSVPGGYVEPKLQQERVISQTFTIKEEKEEQTGLSGPNVKELKSSETNWQQYDKPDKAPELSSIGRAVPQSFNYDEERKFQPKFDAKYEQKYQSKYDSNYDNKYETKYESKFESNYVSSSQPKSQSGKFIPTEDGKSSPQFLAFLTDIKSGGQGAALFSGQSYNSSSNPSYLTKNQQQLGTVSNQSKLAQKGQETYSHESISGYGQVNNVKEPTYESTYQYQPEAVKATETYTYTSKYESNIDPELQADLQRIK